MSAFAQRQNQNQEKHSKIPARSDHVNAQQNSVWDPFFTRQSAWGNQTMQRELRTAAIQAKFAVNRPSDKYEHELTHVTQQGQKVFRNDKSFGEPLVSVKLAVNKSDGERQHILQRLPEPRGVQASGISEDEIEESIEERQSGFAEEETAEQTPEEKINRLKQLYGIDFDSQKALQTLIDYRRNILNHNLPRIAEINPSQLSSYINGFSTASNNINTSVWSLAELKALDQALTFFSNSLSGLVVGKLNFGFNEQNGIWSNSTPDLFAEFIPGTILIYDAAMRKKKVGKSPGRSAER
ncbi:MAG: hypothetical protein QNI97_08190 [Desulfobacterales bacterium]|nr:hypothetical protein [Desulfobacterales bacterium]